MTKRLDRFRNAALVGLYPGTRQLLRDTISAGHEVCSDYPEVEPRFGVAVPPDVFERSVFTAAIARHSEPGLVMHQIALFAGTSPVLGWSDNVLLLRVLGLASVAGPLGVDDVVLVAAARRIYRLRGGEPAPPRTQCRWLTAFVGGPLAEIGEDRVGALRKRLDRHLATVPAREVLGARKSALLSQEGLVTLAKADPRDVAAAFCDLEERMRTVEAHRMLARAEQRRSSRIRDDG